MEKYIPQENRQKDKGEQFTRVDTEKKITGRPRKEINETTFIGLCKIQCTLEEIASVFQCSEDTIENWCKRTFGETFSDTYKKHSAEGKASLRRSMLRLAEKNATMAIFLAKNYLQMSDNVEVKADTSLMSALLDVVKGKPQETEETEPVPESELENYII